MLSQYNPHGLFIALEEIGYLLAAASFGLRARMVQGTGRTRRALRWLLWVGTFGAAATAAWFFSTLGHGREYLLEVALISIDWLVLIGASGLLALRPD